MHLLTIAHNTFRQTVRDRVLYSLIFFVIFLLVAGLLFSQASLGQETRIIADVGLSAMRMFGVALAVFLGARLIARETETRTLAVFLAKPVRRHQFLLGKYLGLAITLWLSVIVMASAVMVAVLYAQTRWGAPPRALWPLWQAALGIWLELLILTAIALFFSTFTSQFLALLLTLLLFVLGNWSDDLRALALSAPDGLTRGISGLLYLLLPNLTKLNFIAPVVNEQPLLWRAWLGAWLYTALYGAAWLAGSVLIFQRRNFK